MNRAVLGALAALLCSLAAPRAAAAPVVLQSAPEVDLYETYTFEVLADRDFSAEWQGGPVSTTPNPWLHVRLDVHFDHPDLAAPIRVPGYFAGDGRGGGIGGVWRAHFTPPLVGTWTVDASLELGRNLNASLPGGAMSPLAVQGYEPLLEVRPLDPGATGFGAKGFVQRAGDSAYFGYSGTDDERFVQCGVGSPENFLGYAGFEGATDGASGAGAICCCRQRCFEDCERDLCLSTVDPAPGFLHRYEAHRSDWRPGDPDWSANGIQRQGRGIIGALNYLGEECGVNSMYVLVMNLGGDGKDTHPFLTDAGALDCPLSGSEFDPSHTLNYHVARLDQWRAVLEHANAKGIMVQLLLAEQESCNIRWFGPHDSNGGPRNHMSVYRRLFMKQMVAHFGHLLALRWNLCEENRSPAACDSAACGSQATALTPQFTAEELDAMGRFIDAWDPNDHPIGVHTIPNSTRVTEELLALPEFPDWLSATSTQVHGEDGAGDIYESELQRLRGLLDQAGVTLPLINDEQGSSTDGLSAETNTGAPWTSTADDRRRRVLYDTLVSGGQVSYYFGYHPTSLGGGDLRTENFRERGDALDQLGIARRLMERARIWRHAEADQRLVGSTPSSPYGDPEVSIERGASTVLVYFPGLDSAQGVPGSLGRLDLRGLPRWIYDATWIIASTGQQQRVGSVVRGGRIVPLATPTAFLQSSGALDTETDLVLLLEGREADGGVGPAFGGSPR